MNKFLIAMTAMSVSLISIQAHAVKHKKEVAPKRTVTRISFETPSAKPVAKKDGAKKDVDTLKKNIARELVSQSKKKPAEKNSMRAVMAKKSSPKESKKIVSNKRTFKSSYCLDGYIANNRAYCAVSKVPAVKKNKVAKIAIKKIEAVKESRTVASDKNLEVKKK